jgi:signal transduction histidine kinase
VVLLALIAFYTLKKQMITSVKLESALRTVNEQSEKLRDLAVVDERNRIAAEMHDTVGHTQTAAVLTLEAAEGLVSEPQAAQKLHKARNKYGEGFRSFALPSRFLAGNETILSPS